MLNQAIFFTIFLFVLALVAECVSHYKNDDMQDAWHDVSIICTTASSVCAGITLLLYMV